jgi:probable phosphoglycerate mutase
MGPTILGIRHGEVHNPEHVIYAGLKGYGLSETGQVQACAVGEALRDAPIAALYASPLDRGIETAQAIADATGAEIIPDERLHEWRHWQQWAGMTWEELRTKARDSWNAYTTDPGSVTSGESLEQLADRMEAWMSDARRAHTGGIVCAVTHLEPLRAVLLRMLGRPAKDLFSIQIGPCDVVRLDPRPESAPIPLDALPELLEREV